MTRIFAFPSTRAAYDRSQWDPQIKVGDVLAVPSEHVVGVLVGAWPCAVTREAGEAFHANRPDTPFPQAIGYHGQTDAQREAITRGVVVACEFAIGLGLELAAWTLDRPHLDVVVPEPVDLEDFRA